MELESEFERRHIAKFVEQFAGQQGAIRILPKRGWWSDITKSAGVYAVYEDGILVYCGETASLRDRMQDLGDTRHHTLRRHIGHKLLAGYPNFSRATSKKKFPDEMEAELDSHMERFSVKVIPVSLERKEVEDAVIERYSPVFNKKPRRGT